MLHRIDKTTVRNALQQAYECTRETNSGKNADYIPYLPKSSEGTFARFTR